MNCAFCQHDEKDHRPPKEYQYAKNMNAAMSPKTSRMVKVTASTNCYSNPLCCCIEFKKASA